MMLRRLVFPCLCLLALSCASANKLADRSARELAAGNPREAYDKARRAIEKEPGNPAARDAMLAAATWIVDDWKPRILNVAAVDTIAAARQVIELADFRDQVARYAIRIPPDTAFAADERALRMGAARAIYRRGVDALEDGRPKRAWAELQGVREFASGYLDTEALIRRARAEGLTRVAILPIVDQADVPGLSQELTDWVYAESAGGIDGQRTPFTELIPMDQVYAKATVAQLSSLTAGEALSLGVKLKADRVVMGRVFGVRAETRTDRYRETLVRRFTERDTAGREVIRWVDVPFDAVMREREVSVQYGYEVIDIRTGEAVAAEGDRLTSFARVVWTDFRPDGDCNRYSLLSPDRRRADASRARGVDDRWKQTFGDWTLPALLEASRTNRSRTHYQSRYRDEFRRDTRGRPVFMAELPREDDLIRNALQAVGGTVLSTLRALDAQD